MGICVREARRQSGSCSTGEQAYLMFATLRRCNAVSICVCKQVSAPNTTQSMFAATPHCGGRVQHCAITGGEDGNDRRWC
jgi:hypothetical protein